MKISIKLANGIEITREFTAEQLQKAENSKQFKKAERNGIKYKYCDPYRYGGCDNCRNQNKCKEQTEKRVDVLNSYVNFLQNM